MAETIDNSAIKEVVRQLVPFLSRKGIPITPENYRLWFEYFLGRKEEIKKTLDELLASDTVFTTELSDKLYKQFFVRDLIEEDTQKLKIEMETADNVSRKASELLINIMKDILGSAENTSGYGDKLKTYMDDMEKANRLEDMQKVLKNVLRDTRETANQSYVVHKKLESGSEELETLNAALVSARMEARTDNLTTLANRRAFDEKMAETMELARQGRSFCLLMLDIDHFKKFNDECGHLIGDKLLKHVAKEIRGACPSSATPCRYGGEEFAVIFSGPFSTALDTAEKIRKAIEEIAFTVRGKDIDVTISIGLASIRKDETVKDVIARGDAAMYLAKKSGRNNVKTEKDIPAGA